MDDEARRARIRQFVEAVNTGKMEPFDALYHDDVVAEWPQSGGVIRSKNIRELRQAYPTPPTATLRRIVGTGDLWAIEMDVDYDVCQTGSLVHIPTGCSHEFANPSAEPARILAVAAPDAIRMVEQLF